jgi:hypothetical protein
VDEDQRRLDLRHDRQSARGDAGVGTRDAEGQDVYLHVFDWPKEGKRSVPGLPSPPKKAYCSARSPEELAIDMTPEEVMTMAVPEKAPDADRYGDRRRNRVKPNVNQPT